MKVRATYILLMVLVAAVIVRHHHNASSKADLEGERIEVATIPPPPASPPPSPKRTVKRIPRPIAQPAPTAKKSTEEKLRETQQDYWTRVEQQFNHQWDELDMEADPAIRARLIQNMAKHVRFDTLAAIEWAMSLEDPTERKMALEAINQYALSGIGAQLEADGTGLPKIKETTIMSALGSSGMVKAGDYIVGMEDENGQLIAFEGMNMTEIVRYLRGKAGSEVRLYMERVSDETGEIYEFEVPVQRSMLVVQPPQNMGR